MNNKQINRRQFLKSVAIITSAPFLSDRLAHIFRGCTFGLEPKYNVYLPYISRSAPLELHVSLNGRYLLDKNDNPFLMIGDSPQGMMATITPGQMETYMANREGYGINALQVHLLAGDTFGGNSITFQAQDSTTPFTTTGDITTPRETYFAQVDAMIELAEQHGMVVILTAAETINGTDLWKNNGTTKCTNFGVYLGNRYKNFPNIIWNYGNDNTPGLDEELDDCLYAVCDGIKSEDSKHLHTFWNFIDSSPREFSGWNSRVDLDAPYCYSVPYGLVRASYNLTPAKPTHMCESYYEAEWDSTPLRIRREAYYTMLAGATGYIYCCGTYTWKFDSGWDTHLDSYPGLSHVKFMKDLLSSRQWYNLIFDTNHDVLTTGYGTYAIDGDIDSNDFSPCEYLSDGSLALIYMPSNRTMTVDMSKFNGTVTANWFDPTDGSYNVDAVSPIANSGLHNFSRSGVNSAGDHDWVLVLEA